MNAAQRRTAIARLQMLTASAETDADVAAIDHLLGTFTEHADQRELIRALAAAVAARTPGGGSFPLTDRGDWISAGLLDAVEHLPPDVFAEVLEHLPDELLSEVAGSLVVFWRYACELAAAVTLSQTEIPEHAPKEAR